MPNFSTFLTGRHIKRRLPWSRHKDTWMARGLHANNFFSGSATMACFAFVPLLTWGLMWTPLKNDVDRQIVDLAFVDADVGCYVDPFINDVVCQIAYMAHDIADVEIVCCGHICPLRGLTNVHRDNEMSCETSSSTRTFNLKDFEFCSMLCLTAFMALARFMWHHVGHCMSLQCGGENISKCDGEFLETPSHSWKHRAQHGLQLAWMLAWSPQWQFRHRVERHEVHWLNTLRPLGRYYISETSPPNSMQLSNVKDYNGHCSTTRLFIKWQSTPNGTIGDNDDASFLALRLRFRNTPTCYIPPPFTIHHDMH